MVYNFRHISTCPFCRSAKFKLLGRRLNGRQGFFPGRKKGITVSVARCRLCGLIFSDPLPVPESIQNHYGVSPELYWKPEYFNFSELNNNGIIRWMKQICDIPPGSTVLDIGAGIGKNMEAFEKQGYEVYGIEPSESFYRLATEKTGIRKDRLSLCSIEDSDFSSNSFNVILMSAVLEHIYEPAAALTKAISWLKPGGLLFVEVPSSKWLLSRLANFFYKIRFIDYVTNLSPMHEPYHLYEFTKKTFDIHSVNNDYEVIACRNNVCETFLPPLFDVIARKIMKISGTGMEIALWLRKK